VGGVSNYAPPTWFVPAGCLELDELPAFAARRSGDFAGLFSEVNRLTGSCRPRLSLTMIVKNEEANLADCLRSAQDLVDEIIIVDTGSADRTKTIAKEFGARVFDFLWIDSFAAARNEALRHATGDWILWLDADDRLDEENRRHLRDLCTHLPNERVAYVMKVRSLVDSTSDAPRLLDQVRLYPNHLRIRWEHRIHEQILPSIRRLGGDVRWTPVIVDHTGYQDPALRQRKLQRNWRLLQLEDADQPEDPFTLFNLGWTALDLGQVAEALPLLRRSLERSQPDASIVRKLYILLSQCHRQLSQHDESLAACREGRLRFPDDAELLYEEGVMLHDKNDLVGAEGCLLRLLKTEAGQYFASVDAGLRGYKARHQLARVYLDQGNVAAAETHWRAAMAERGDYTPAGVALGELLLTQQRWSDFEQALRSLEASGHAAGEAAVLRSRGHLAGRIRSIHSTKTANRPEAE